MSISEATSGFGTLLQVGDGGIGAGTQASKTIGTSNQQIIFYAKTPGVAGNSKTAGILVSGNSTVFALSVSADAILVTSATDGGGLATTTVNELLYQLMQNDIFVEHWEATRGVGNGTGVLVAGASAALTSGADGTEVFTTIAEIKTISGPNFEMAFAEVTHMESPDAVREFVPTLIDAGEVNYTSNFLPDNTVQSGVRTDLLARTKKNFKMIMVDAAGDTVATWSFAGYHSRFNLQTPLDGAAEITGGVKLTSTITES